MQTVRNGHYVDFGNEINSFQNRKNRRNLLNKGNQSRNMTGKEAQRLKEQVRVGRSRSTSIGHDLECMNVTIRDHGCT